MRNKNFEFAKIKTSLGGTPYTHYFTVTVRDKEITKVYENGDRGAGYIFAADKQKDLLGENVARTNTRWVMLMKEFGHDTTKLEKAFV